MVGVRYRGCHLQNHLKTRLSLTILSQKDLCISRIIFYIFTFLIFVEKDFTEYLKIPASFYEPVFILDVLNFPTPYDLPYFEYWVSIWKISLITSSIGLFSKISKWISFFGAFYFLSLDTGFGFDHHRYYIIVVFLGLLAINNLSTHYTLDSVLFKKSNTPVQTFNPTLLFKLSLCLMYFSSGYTKLIQTGIVFFTEDTLKEFMTVSKSVYAPYREHSILTFESIRNFVYNSTHFHKVIAFLGLTFEILSPLAILNSQLSILFIGSVLIMHFTIFILMYIHFFESIGCLVFWIPWTNLLGQFRWWKK